MPVPPKPEGRGWRRFLPLILLALVLVAGPAGPAGAVTGPTLATPPPVDLYAGVLPARRQAVIAATAGHLSRYRIAATLHPATNGPNTLSGQEDLLFSNQTGKAQPDLYFRLYANAPEYAAGGMAVHGVTVNGAAITPELSVAETVLRLHLPTPVATGATADVRLAFTTTVPTDPRQSYGMFAFDTVTGTWALAHWYPILAGYDPVSGWVLSSWASWGDPIFSNTSLYDVSITAPTHLVLATSGVATSSTATNGTTTRRYVTGPVRDFVLVADNDFRALSRDVNGVHITSFFNPDHAAGGAAVLQAAAQAVAVYDRLFGPYPYKSLDLVEIRLQGAGGVEFPQLVFIDSSRYAGDPAPGTIPAPLDFTVAHEIAHQWWYGMVGNDQYQHAFLDEALANESTILYLQQQYGAARAKHERELNILGPYLAMLFTRGDEIVDQPTNNFPDTDAYAVIVYDKGELAFDAIRGAIGDAAFFRGLQGYLAAERFQVAAPADLRAAFEKASGRDLTALWTHWFDTAGGRQDYTRQDLAQVRKDLAP